MTFLKDDIIRYRLEKAQVIMPLFAEAENFNITILEFLRSGEKEIEKN